MVVVLNTSVKPILNKFITQVASHSDKISYSGFHLQNHARPLLVPKTNAYIFKIPAPICTNFGTIERHDIVNISVIRQVKC